MPSTSWCVLGDPTSISAGGVTEQGLDALVDDTLAGVRTRSRPREGTLDEIRALY